MVTNTLRLHFIAWVAAVVLIYRHFLNSIYKNLSKPDYPFFFVCLFFKLFLSPMLTSVHQITEKNTEEF